MANLKVQKITWDETGTVATIEYQKIGKVLVIDTKEFKNQADAAQHGYGQRFGDLESGDETGKRKYDAAVALKQHYLDGGDWRMSPERDTTKEVIEALHSLDPAKYPMEKLVKAAEVKPEQVKVWRADARVKARIAKIRADKAAKAAKEAEKTDIEVNID